MFDEEFLHEHVAEESVLDTGIVLGIEESKMHQFIENCEKRLAVAFSEDEQLSCIVCAALETEGRHIARPEVIVEALKVNTPLRLYALHFADMLQQRHVH